MQICDGYNPRVLMGNWYEESYSVEQASRSAPRKASREPQVQIGYIDAHLRLKPLNRIARLQPWNTNSLLDTPQFANLSLTTTAKENYDLATTMHHFQKWQPRLLAKARLPNTKSFIRLKHCNAQPHMFNSNNVKQLLQSRQVKQTDFKNTLCPNRHVQTILTTTYGQSYEANVKSQSNFLSQATKQEISKPSPCFRRMRSEITLHRAPIQTMK